MLVIDLMTSCEKSWTSLLVLFGLLSLKLLMKVPLLLPQSDRNNLSPSLDISAWYLDMTCNAIIFIDNHLCCLSKLRVGV